MSRIRELEGRNVLLVEDESLVSLLAEDIITDAGAKVTLAMRLEEGLAAALCGSFDGAILDVNLGGGETSYPIADALAEREIPFIFATGYAANGLAPRFQNHRVVQKPYNPLQLIAALRKALEEHDAGATA